METAPKFCHVISSSDDRGGGVEAYLDALRKEQTRYLEAIEQARTLLDGSCRLARAAAIQTQLARRFLDAQRAIQRRHAEVESELALIACGESPDVCELDRTYAARQLAVLLDDWWNAANENGRALLDGARARAELAPPMAAFSPPTGLPLQPPRRLSPDLASAAEEVPLEIRRVDDGAIIRLAPEPLGLRPIGASW